MQRGFGTFADTKVQEINIFIPKVSRKDYSHRPPAFAHAKHWRAGRDTFDIVNPSIALATGGAKKSYTDSLCFLKQSLQRTGLFPFGSKGTVSLLPQFAQVIGKD